MKLSYLFIIIALLGFSQLSTAQETPDTSKVVVTTYDGKERVGVILQDDGREILLMSDEMGKIFIRKDNIKSIKSTSTYVIEKMDGKEYRFAGPFTTRYYFTTNALPIKKGEDYSMIHLYGPEVHFSVTNKFSIGVMTSWIASPFVLALKHTFPTKNEKINFGLGTLIGTSGYLNTFRGYGGLHWGMVTFGDRFKNLTISAGYAYLEIGNEKKSFITPGTYPTSQQYYGGLPKTEMSEAGLITTPVLSLAGITKMGKKTSFIFDSMFFFSSQEKSKSRSVVNNDNTVTWYIDKTQEQTFVMYLMPGVRWQSSDASAFQLALAGITYKKLGPSDMVAFPMPMCSWLFKF